MPDKITVIDPHTVSVELDNSGEIVSRPEFTQADKDELDVVLGMKYQQYRKDGNTKGMARIVKVLVKIDPANAEKYADKTGDDEAISIVNDHKRDDGAWCRWSKCEVRAGMTKCPEECRASAVTVEYRAADE
jgi:hypothetical protein